MRTWELPPHTTLPGPAETCCHGCRYLRERNRDATGVDLERQVAYCSQLPPFWRNLYGGLFGLVLLVTVLVSLRCLSPSIQETPEPADGDCVRTCNAAVSLAVSGRLTM